MSGTWQGVGPGGTVSCRGEGKQRWRFLVQQGEKDIVCPFRGSVCVLDPSTWGSASGTKGIFKNGCRGQEAP